MQAERTGDHDVENAAKLHSLENGSTRPFWNVGQKVSGVSVVAMFWSYEKLGSWLAMTDTPPLNEAAELMASEFTGESNSGNCVK